MKYNLSKAIDKQNFKQKCNELYEEGEFVELKKIHPPASNAQKRYLHLLFGWLAIELGETLEFVKQEIFKKVVNKEIFKTEYTNRKTGEVREDWKSVNDPDTAELTLAIERLRNYAAMEYNYYLPEPNEKEYLKEIEIEMDRQRQYI